ncbi:NifU family protein [Bacteriovoracaceae bacterium]|nr:NifU family protein [Bacteriovoracaceae bacterium]
MIRKLEKIFDDQVRPVLASHGGNVEIVDVNADSIYLRLQGGCQGCSSSAATLKGGIETIIKNNFPFIQNVIDVTEHAEGENPYM